MGRNSEALTPRRVQIHAHVESEMHRGLVAVARENDRSVSAEIRRAVAEHVKQSSRSDDA